MSTTNHRIHRKIILYKSIIIPLTRYFKLVENSTIIALADMTECIQYGHLVQLQPDHPNNQWWHNQIIHYYDFVVSPVSYKKIPLLDQEIQMVPLKCSLKEIPMLLLMTHKLGPLGEDFTLLD